MTAAFTTDELRWKALLKRDRRADGVFWYAVKTTGVYCRPGCSSRRPRRANVEFFDSPLQAERAGYRACKKCGPDALSVDHTHSAVIEACKLIDQSSEPLTLNELAGAVGLSPYHFHRLFKKYVGVTPKAYSAACRTKRLQTELREKTTITKAMYGAGFGSSSRLYERVGDHLGMPPSAYKNGGAGQSIRFATAKCSLGWIAVAVTERGICSIEFGDKRSRLREALSKRFPKAEMRADDAGLQETLTQVLAGIENPDHRIDLPLDIQGTAFQRRVWAALQGIPAGTTATYTEIAKRIGRPTAARAVARACASNKLAVAIPCHRVLRADGSLSGYRWGIERKRKLLERERTASDKNQNREK